MSINLYYKLTAECSEEELLEKLNRLRTRRGSLPLRSVSPVTKVDPVYQSHVLMGMLSQGLTLPPIVANPFFLPTAITSTLCGTKIETIVNNAATVRPLWKADTSDDTTDSPEIADSKETGEVKGED